MLHFPTFMVVFGSKLNNLGVKDKQLTQNQFKTKLFLLFVAVQKLITKTTVEYSIFIKYVLPIGYSRHDIILKLF